jgi:hypothetical protein
MPKKERHKDLKSADGVLTKALNTDPYITAWLVSAMSRLRDHIGSSEDGTHFFHVKGGTSLKLFLDNLVRRSNGSYTYDPDKVSLKPSDWDTQLIINPNLPQSKWNKIFLKLDKLITNDLMFLQEEFTKVFKPRFVSELANKYKDNFPGGHKQGVILADQDAKGRKAKIDEWITVPTMWHEYNRSETLYVYDIDETWPKDLEEDVETVSFDLRKNDKNKYLASVLCNYGIRNFYLYRLMVHFNNINVSLEIGRKKPKYRAELIDITIPRQHSCEALEQWHHTRNIIVSVQKSRGSLEDAMKEEPNWFNTHFAQDPPTHFYLPVPLHEYHLAEQILMVREHFDPKVEGTKPDKRIARGAAICKAIDEKFGGRIDITNWEKWFPETDKKLHFTTLKGGNDSQWPLFLCLLMAQFIEAYDLLTNLSLRSVFDKYFSDKLSGNYNGFKECVKIVHDVSQDMEKAAKTLHDYFKDKIEDNGRNRIIVFIQALATAFDKGAKYPSAIVVTGSYAAHLHQGGAPIEESYIESFDLNLYYSNGEPKNILNQALSTFSNGPNNVKIKWKPEDCSASTIYVYLTQGELQFDGCDDQMTPCFAKINLIERDPYEIPVSYLSGTLVFSLQKSIEEYKDRIARIEEYAVGKRLMKVLEILEDKAAV